MAEYRLTAPPLLGGVEIVVRTVDHAFIPNDPGNADWIMYQKWLEDGGKPDPYVPPEPEPEK
jgi:hypothetical protein